MSEFLAAEIRLDGLETLKQLNNIEKKSAEHSERKAKAAKEELETKKKEISMTKRFFSSSTYTEAGKKAIAMTKKLPKEIIKATKELPKKIKEVVKEIPSAFKKGVVSFGKGLKNVGLSIGSSIKGVVIKALKSIKDNAWGVTKKVGKGMAVGAGASILAAGFFAANDAVNKFEQATELRSSITEQEGRWKGLLGFEDENDKRFLVQKKLIEDQIAILSDIKKGGVDQATATLAFTDLLQAVQVKAGGVLTNEEAIEKTGKLLKLGQDSAAAQNKRFEYFAWAMKAGILTGMEGLNQFGLGAMDAEVTDAAKKLFVKEAKRDDGTRFTEDDWQDLDVGYQQAFKKKAILNLVEEAVMSTDAGTSERETASINKVMRLMKEKQDLIANNDKAGAMAKQKEIDSVELSSAVSRAMAENYQRQLLIEQANKGGLVQIKARQDIKEVGRIEALMSNQPKLINEAHAYGMAGETKEEIVREVRNAVQAILSFLGEFKGEAGSLKEAVMSKLSVNNLLKNAASSFLPVPDWMK